MTHLAVLFAHLLPAMLAAWRAASSAGALLPLPRRLGQSGDRFNRNDDAAMKAYGHYRCPPTGDG